MRIPDAPARLPRTAAALTAAVAVGVIVVGGAAMTGTGTVDRGTLTGTTGSDVAPTGTPDEMLDVRPLTAEDTDEIAGCLTSDFASSPAEVTVRYGVEQTTATGSIPVLVLENADGDLLLCDAEGTDRPAVAPVPRPSADAPVVFLSNGRTAWDCDGATLEQLRTTTWLAVSDDVATVRQRTWVDSEAGPWFTTAARDGISHLQTWLVGPLPADVTLRTETQVLDAGGAPVDQDAVPTGPQDLAACSNGDTAIG